MKEIKSGDNVIVSGWLQDTDHWLTEVPGTVVRILGENYYLVSIPSVDGSSLGWGVHILQLKKAQ